MQPDPQHEPELPPGEDAEGVSRELEARGILVRYFDEAALADTLRITIGTDDEQTALLETLRPILDATSAATG